MAHRYRFFGNPENPGRWSLEDDEITHALKVLRLENGAEIEVTNGKGDECVARLVVVSKSKAYAEVISETSTRKDPITRTIVLGALKPGDVDDLIAPLVELGVDRVIVFRQDDTPQFRVNSQSTERWQRLVRSAVKQSKRPWLVTVEAADHIEAAMELAGEGGLKWFLDPDAPEDLLTTLAAPARAESFIALIGGEKGLSDRESALAHKSGYKPVRLGPWVLRARTAALGAAVFLGMTPRPKSS